MTIYNLFSLLGGLGVLLYGMRMMSEGLEKAAGEKLRKLMGILTTNRFMGMIVGMVVAAIVQSSGATVMIVGFVNAGLMTLSQAVGVIMGTNVGTALLTQVMALDIKAITPLFIMIGVIPMMFSKVHSRQMLGQILAGFGLLFLGMSLMSDAMNPLRTMPAFQALMTKFSNPLLGVLVGTLFTAVVQSSAASVAILQTLAGQGLISLSGAVYLVLGFNIGTTSSAAISCIGSPRPGCRAAIMHTAIKTVGAILFVLFIQLVPLVDWLEAITPNSVSWQISNAHLVFNLINTIVLFPFANLFVKLALKLLPMQEGETKDELVLKYINTNMLRTPAIAVDNMRREVMRMGELAYHNLEMATEALFEKKTELVTEVQEKEKMINFLNTEITAYLVKLSQTELSVKDAQMVADMYHIVSDIERIGDHAENITEYTTELVDGNLSFSEKGAEELKEMTERVLGVLKRSLVSLNANDVSAARVAQAEELDVDAMAEQFRLCHIDRMRHEICDPATGTIYTDMIINLERIADHADNIAERVVAESGKKEN